MTSNLPQGEASDPLPARIPVRWAIYSEHEPAPVADGVIRDVGVEDDLRDATPDSKVADAPVFHAVYWWQIRALMIFEREMEIKEFGHSDLPELGLTPREAGLLAWANVELRNDE
jgi:hypothetical protein